MIGLLMWIALAAPPTDARFECLRASYPTVVRALDAGHVVLADGTRLPWDDGVPRTGDDWLARPDIEDTFTPRYPVGPGSTPPPKGADPGRARNQALMKALWGADAKAVGAQLVEVEWMPTKGGKTLRFHRAHGAADALRRVSAELEALPAKHHRYVIKTAGTFNWRRIKGTDRLSAHAYGIAIDIDVSNTNYWRWAIKREPALPWRNRIPLEIVEVFERHGFVWGGKWHHYDTMHFEYRPELLHPACVARPGG